MAEPAINIVVGVQPDYNQIVRAANQAAKAFAQPLGRITSSANEFQKSLEASNARVIAFGASAGAILAVRTAFSKLIDSTIEVERALAEINNLLRLGSRDLVTFAGNLFKVANATGTSFAD